MHNKKQRQARWYLSPLLGLLLIEGDLLLQRGIQGVVRIHSTVPPVVLQEEHPLVELH